MKCPECNGKMLVGQCLKTKCYLCKGSGHVKSEADMAKCALFAQSACNGIALAGTLHEFSSLYMQVYKKGTTGAFQAAPCKLIFMQMSMLMGVPSIFDEYNEVYKECERLAEEELVNAN